MKDVKKFIQNLLAEGHPEIQRKHIGESPKVGWLKITTIKFKRIGIMEQYLRKGITLV